jgi:hypothetical protein
VSDGFARRAFDLDAYEQRVRQDCAAGTCFICSIVAGTRDDHLVLYRDDVCTSAPALTRAEPACSEGVRNASSAVGSGTKVRHEGSDRDRLRRCLAVRSDGDDRSHCRTGICRHGHHRHHHHLRDRGAPHRDALHQLSGRRPLERRPGGRQPRSREPLRRIAGDVRVHPRRGDVHRDRSRGGEVELRRPGARNHVVLRHDRQRPNDR